MEQLFAPVEQSMIVCGHTHMQFKLKLRQKIIFNAGSVGMPFADKPGAYWLFIEADHIEFKRTNYDLKAAAKLIEQHNCPFAADFINHHLLHVPTPQEAMAVLHKISIK